MTHSRRSFMKKAGLGFLYLTTACTKADIYVGEFDFDDEDLSSNPSDPSSPSDPSNPSAPSSPSAPSNNFSIYNKSWEEIYNQEVYSHYNAQFNNADDYTNKVYIDPTYQGGDSNGSLEKPFLSLLDVPEASDTAYLIKRGTSHDISGERYFSFNSSDIMIGPYGDGSMPILTGNRQIEIRQPRCIVRDIHMSTIRVGTYNGVADDCVLFNLILDGTSENVVLGRNCKIIGCEIKDNTVNGLFVQQRDMSKDSNMEIGYCHIHSINQLWFGPPRQPQTPAGGDPIHFGSSFRGHFWVHHNILDRSDTGNKFCFIINVKNEYNVDVTGLFEYNICYGPMSDPSGGNILYFSGGGRPFDVIIRNNALIGSYDDVSETWTENAIYIKKSKVEIYGNFISDVNIAFTRSNNLGGDSYFYNNTVVDIKGDNILTAVLATLQNNILPSNKYYVGGGTQVRNNIYLDEYPDDIFIESGYDYRLREGSPGLNSGEWKDFMDREWKNDLLGNNVPHDNTINIGCFQ